MSALLERAFLLFNQERYSAAADTVRQQLASDPEDADAHQLLALCLLEQDQLKAAVEHAELAIALDPADHLSHFTLARVRLMQNRFEEAKQAVQRAITLEPQFVPGYALLSNLHFQQSRWREALAVADQGLSIDPDDTTCLNMRAMAEVKLGRSKDAAATLADVLERNPDNAWAHANQGWVKLEQGDPKQATIHFKEALRLEPDLEWARAGIVEAIKARNPLYRWLLYYFLWMAKFSSRMQFGILIGGYFGFRAVSQVARNNPALAPWLIPLIVLYVVFALVTWLGDPLMNVLLRLHPLGRHALSDDQKRGANLTLLLLLAPLAVLGVGWAVGTQFQWYGLAALFALLLVLPGSAIYACDVGWPRQVAWLVLGGLAFLGLPLIAVFMFWPVPQLPLIITLWVMLGLKTYGWAVLISQFGANYLTQAKVRG